MFRINWRKAATIIAFAAFASGLVAEPAAGHASTFAPEAAAAEIAAVIEFEGAAEPQDPAGFPDGELTDITEAQESTSIPDGELIEAESVMLAPNDPMPLPDSATAGPNDAEDSAAAMRSTAALTNCELVGTPQTQYQNIILFIGDGMGQNQVALARRAPQEPLAMETLPVSGESITTSLTGVTDSAAGATALAYGYRVVNGQIGVPGVKSISELALSYGKAVGVVTTDHTWGATPSAFALARVDRRNDEVSVSAQELASGLNLIWGGDSTSVNRQNTAANGFQYVATRAEWNNTTSATRSFGQFKNADLRNIQNNASTPNIRELTEKAISQLSADPDGFFLMVEGAHIDKASHDADLNKTIAHVRELDNAIAAGLAFANSHPDTLIVVTADHETGGLLADGQYSRPGQHTGANVPVFVNRTDAGFTGGCVSENQAIGRALQQVLKTGHPTPPTPDIVGSEFNATGAVTLTSPIGRLPGTGTIITAKVDGFRPANGIEYTFEWFNGGKTPIQVNTTTGKTNTYPATDFDADKTITVKVTATKDGYKPTTVESLTGIPIGKQLAAGTVTISAPAGVIAQTGTKLNAKVEDFRPANGILYTFDWFNGSRTPIQSSTITGKSENYLVTDSDAGKVITVRVTANKDGYQPASAESKTGIAVEKQLTSTGTVSISAATNIPPGIGTKLTAKVDGFRPASDIAYTYLWYRATNNGNKALIQASNPTSAKTNSYVLTAQDMNKTITVTVIANKAGYQNATVTAAL